MNMIGFKKLDMLVVISNAFTKFGDSVMAYFNLSLNFPVIINIMKYEIQKRASL